MTKQEFMQGLAVLKAYGLEQDLKDKLKLKLWFEDLQHLPMDQYEKAVVQLRKVKTTWFPSDNVPALILEQVKLIPKERKYFWDRPENKAWGDYLQKQRLLKQGGE